MNTEMTQCYDNNDYNSVDNRCDKYSTDHKKMYG